MSFLPTPIIDIIYNYIQQLNKTDLHKELKQKFYKCCCCGLLHCENIIKITADCEDCKKPICNDCDTNFYFIYQKFKKLCNECYYIGQIKRTITTYLKRKINKQELSRLNYLLFDQDLYKLNRIYKLMLINYSFILNNEEYETFEDILEHLRYYINNFNYDESINENINNIDDHSDSSDFFTDTDYYIL